MAGRWGCWPATWARRTRRGARGRRRGGRRCRCSTPTTRSGSASVLGSRGRPGQPGRCPAGLLAAGAGGDPGRDSRCPPTGPARPPPRTPVTWSTSGSVRNVHAGLVEVARAGRATLFMVVQAALAVLLSRHGGGDDIPLGTSVAGRGDAALDELIGMFLNTLVLRADVSGDPTFAELVGRVREADLGAYAHQDLPFEHLVEALSPARSLARNPLYPGHAHVPEHPRRPASHLGPPRPARHARSGTDIGGARFDLAVTLWERRDAAGTPAGLEGDIQFAADLFDQATVEALADRLAAGAGAGGGGSGFAGQPGGGARARPSGGRSCGAGTTPPRTLPGRRCGELVAAQVARTPDAPAVVCGDVTWSYAELDAASGRLARYLVGLGAGPEQVVAVALPRSAEMVVARARRGQGRGGVSAGGPGVSGGADRFHAGRRAAGAGRVHRGDGGRCWRRGVARWCWMTRQRRRRSRRCAPAGRACGPSVDGAGVCDLHVRVDRGAQGRRGDRIAGWPAWWPARRTGSGSGRGRGCCSSPSLSFDAAVSELAVTLGSGGALVVPRRGSLADAVAGGAGGAQGGDRRC